MSILQQQASDVRTQEIDLSTVITSASSAIACQVLVSKQGSPNPKFFTNAQDYLAEYGLPDAAVSFDIYCGLSFFTEGSGMWSRRAIHSDATYGAALLYYTGTETKLLAIDAGVANPLAPDWDALVPSPSDEAIALFWPKPGPGSYSSGYSVALESENVATPTGLAAVSAPSTGTLPASTYEYQIAAIGTNGETLASSPVVVTIASASNNSITLTWDTVPKAVGYRVYGRTDTALGFLVDIGQGTLTFVDTGALTVDTDRPPIVSPADLPEAATEFTVMLSNGIASQNFVCTLADNTDDNGMSTELEERINPFSTIMNVTSNVFALSTVPLVDDAVKTLLAGGDSGTAPTSSDVAAAYQVFKNKQLYKINTLINGGHADPIVQKAMDTLVQARGEAVALLDLPSSRQLFQDAINYRNLDLNLNSSYSALFGPDVLHADNINGKQLYIPFSGWAAALCARTDRVANPSFSIAGLNRGLVDVLKSRYTYDDGEATELFKSQINYTRTFIGQGIALWEQQTLSAKSSALSWLSVRRITNVIKVSLYQFLIYALQEPDDDFLGRQIVTSCSAYLEVIKNARALSDYRVVSDTSNNSAAQLNSGIRVVTVVLVPTIPVHEIQLQVVISKQGVSFQEVLQQAGR